MPEHDERFEAVFARSRSAMLISDAQRRVVRANPAAVALTGCTQEELEGMRIDDLWVPEERGQLRDHWSRLKPGTDLVGHRMLPLAGGGAVPVNFCVAALAATGEHLSVYEPTIGEAAQTVSVLTTATAAARSPLTRRETEVVLMLALGHSGAEAAAMLHLSPETVRTYLRNAMLRTGTHTRTHLVARALQAGWLPHVR